MPATPPPTTRALCSISTSVVMIGLRVSARLIAMRTRSMALVVAAWRSCEWTQEHWLRTLAISNRAGFSPAARMLSWNRGPWV